jgi:predicted LPLAT superfamily acyltransferase
VTVQAEPQLARAASSEASSRTWLSHREKGAIWGIQLGYFIATSFGRVPVRLLIRGISLWYALLRPEVRAASRQWLEASTGKKAKFWNVYFHLVHFAQATADRIFFLRGKTKAFRVTRTGHEHLVRALEAGTGAILLGAHMGSFEALRADGHDTRIPINILGHFENARMINSLFERLNPDLSARVIHFSGASVDFIFQVQEAIGRGEFVGTMGDRVGLNEKSVIVDFLGRKARFPTGPFILASVLKCPVLLTFGLYREPNCYDLYCEPFAEQLSLPRKNREARLVELVQAYAHRLEEYCRLAPYNWFNFYDFWASAADGGSRASGEPGASH